MEIRGRSRDFEHAAAEQRCSTSRFGQGRPSTGSGRTSPHGYALMEAVTDLSGGRVRLKPGSLYATLDRLEREGLVSESGTEVVSGRHRRYYALTDAGTEALSGQVERLERLAATAADALRRRRVERARSSVGQAAGELNSGLL